MDINISVNPSANETKIDICTDEENVKIKREPPPPYSLEVPVTNQPTVRQTIIVQPPLKNAPTFYTCPNCGERVLTKVEYLNSRKTHLVAGFIGGFTFWCLLCCLAAIPYLIKTCKKAHHYCPNCDKFLGAYSKV